MPTVGRGAKLVRMRPLILLPLCLTLVAQSTGPFTVMGGFMKGNDYLTYGSPERSAYAAGFVNGMSVAALALNVGNSNREMKWLADCTEGMTDKQIAEIILKSIKDNPSEWHHGLNILSLNAMTQSCKSYWTTTPQK
jgi:hypothetical protein